MAKVPVEFTPEHIRANSSPSDLYRPFLASNEPVASLLRTDFHVSARRGLGVHSRDAGQLRDGEAPGLDLRDETLYYNTRGEAEKYWAGKDLPRPTKDIRRLRHDLKTWGYCLIEEALSSEQLARVQKRVYDQAVGERRAGIAIFTGANPAPGQEVGRSTRWPSFN